MSDDFREPSEEETSILVAANLAEGEFGLMPVYFNGQQRFALALERAEGIQLLGICVDLEKDTIVNLDGDAPICKNVSNEDILLN